MEPSKLSEYYALAADRSMRTIASFYEATHTDKGDPITDPEEVQNVVNMTLTILQSELDLCIEAAKEYNEE